MAKVEGDLSLMPLPDLMQWIEMTNKSGTLLIEHEGIAKRFYLQDGKIIFVSSQKKGEMLGEYLLSKNLIGITQLKESVQKSQALGIPFVGYLISEGIVNSETLESILRELAETAFIDALKWDGGTFQFKDSLPPSVVNSPIKINTSYVVFQSLNSTNINENNNKEIIKRLAQKISSGAIELPPVPDIIVKLNEVLNNENTNVTDIAKIIMSDQILTSKILRIVNSSFYARYGKITSLQQAIIYIGMKALISVVTVYTMGDTSARNAEKIKDVLKHSLITAFIARHLAPYISVDPEEAFVCGLLHDIGKTVILEHLNNHSVTDETIREIINKFHTEVGFILAIKWRFSDIIKETIRLHHNPDDTEKFRDMLHLIAISNWISNNINTEDSLAEPLKDFLDQGLDLQEFMDILHSFVEEASLFV